MDQRIHTLYRTCDKNSPLREQHVGGGLGKWDYTLKLINLTHPVIKPPGIWEILADK